MTNTVNSLGTGAAIPVAPTDSGSPPSSTPSVAPVSTFAKALSIATAGAGADVGAREFRSGRVAVCTNSRGLPSLMKYFKEDGTLLHTSEFYAPTILRNADRFGLDLKDLRGVGKQLDEAKVGYRPYELYPGTGSDAGIDFEDLIAGGLGTAFDWRKDENLSAKGPLAAGLLAADQTLATRLELKKNAQVTTERGIDPAKFLPIKTKSGEVLSVVSFNGQSASWHSSTGEAMRASPFVTPITLGAQAIASSGPGPLALSFADLMAQSGAVRADTPPTLAAPGATPSNVTAAPSTEPGAMPAILIDVTKPAETDGQTAAPQPSLVPKPSFEGAGTTIPKTADDAPTGVKARPERIEPTAAALLFARAAVSTAAGPNPNVQRAAPETVAHAAARKRNQAIARPAEPSIAPVAVKNLAARTIAATKTRVVAPQASVGPDLAATKTSRNDRSARNEHDWMVQQYLSARRLRNET